MKNENFTQYIDQLIANDYLKEAIDALLAFFNKIPHKESTNGLKNRVIVQSQRLMDALNSFANGMSQKQDLEISKTKIGTSLTDIKNEINELEEYSYAFTKIIMKTPEDKKKDRIKEDAGDYVDTQYHIFLKSLKRYWWFVALWFLFAVFVVGGGFKAIQAIMNSSSDTHNSSTDTPSNECNLNVYPGCKLYAQPDDNALIIMDVPMNKAFQPIGSQGKFLRGEKVLFFKIKVKNTEGWVKYSEMNLRKTPQCFEIEKAILQKLSNSATPSNNGISQKNDKKVSTSNEEDEFKKAEREFDKQHATFKSEHEKGMNEAMKNFQEMKKEVDNKLNRQ